MTDEKRPLKVFLCHAHDDKAKARELYRTLKRRGLQPWLDAEDLLPGQAWQVEIPKALETSDAIIILLSQTSVDKEGYVQKEIKFALDKTLEMPEGRIFVIPARLDECDVPRSLRDYHWVDLFEQGGYDKLMKSLRLRAEQLESAGIKMPKPSEPKPDLPKNPESELSKKISVHVDGSVEGNIIIGSNNIVGSLTSSENLRENYDVIFIGHAQDDRDFPLWLSLQLISQGYSVWCDLLNLEPGHNSNEVVRQVIKSKAIKYLYVLTNDSNQNSEALKEFRFAYDVMRERKMEGFVIPLEIEMISIANLNILLQESKAIDFSNGWAKGLGSLLDYLDKNSIPKHSDLNIKTAKEIWRTQFSVDKGVEFKSEELLSNWFPFTLPEIVYFHELKRSGIGSIEVVESNLPFAGFQHNIYLVSFAPESDFDGKLGFGLSIKNTTPVSVADFLSGDYNQRLISKELSWRVVSRLLNDAWERYFTQVKNVGLYRLANNQPCYYFKSGFSDKSDNKSFFTGVDGNRTWRSLVGLRLGKYWHFGIQGKVSLHPEPIFIVKSHVLFSDDGHNIWTSKERLHSARRSACKNWWNVEWRDRLLASMAFFADSDGSLHIPIGNNLDITVSATPLLFSIPVSYLSVYDKTDVQAEDEDLDLEEYDDVEEDEFDEEGME